MLKQLIAHRRALHRIPELDDQLPKTQAYLLSQLEGLRCRIITPGRSAVLAYFDVGKPDTAAFRSDMDALPIEEQTGLSFCSKHPGRMHACGHDGHMAMLLCLAQWINGHLDQLSRNVLLVFQPAEEPTGGARDICQTGIFRAVKRPAYFWHPPLAGFACRDHWHPQRANDGSFQRDDGRNHRQKPPYCQMAGGGRCAGRRGGIRAADLCHGRFGTAAGMVPGVTNSAICKAEPCATRSAPIPCWRGRFALSRMKRLTMSPAVPPRLARRCQERTGCQISVRFSEGYPPVYNDPALYDQVSRLLGPDGFVPLQKPALIAEDFSFTSRYCQVCSFSWASVGTTRFTLPAFSLTKRCWNGEWRCIKRFCNFDFHQLST